MRREKGLTLIELAIVLIVLGILLGIGAGVIGVLIKRVKYNESKEIVNAAVEGIIGYVISQKRLPVDDNSNDSGKDKFGEIVRNTDSYGKKLAYIYDSKLTEEQSNVCDANSTNITVKVCSDSTCSSPVQTIKNVAFLVISGDGNYNNQTAGTREVRSSTEIRVYKYGVEVDNYPGDVDRVEPYDDIVKWVSLYELKAKAGCVGSGGSGGGGGGCSYGSPITVKNTGGLRWIKRGTASSSSHCRLSNRCTQFESIDIEENQCYAVYKNWLCRERAEKVFDYEDAYSADSNRDCIVNYNSGSLVDN